MKASSRARPRRAQTAATPRVAAFTRVVLEVFKLHGRLLAEGNELGRDLALTASRWQVLGAVAIEGRALTVAEIARVMGMTRQGVQRVVDDVEAAGLVRREAHPAHRKARPVGLTERGREVYAAMSRRQAPWAERCAAALEPTALVALAQGLAELRAGIDAAARASAPAKAGSNQEEE